MNMLLHRLFFSISILCCVFVLADADDYEKLRGCWKCNADGETFVLEFKTQHHLVFDGDEYRYQMIPGVISVQEEFGLVKYLYTLNDDKLSIRDPEGAGMECRPEKKTEVTKDETKKTNATDIVSKDKVDDSWPPKYEKPSSTPNELNPDTKTLLYKFAGRWDNVTTNTLTNMYLKPDGTYEEAYESGYSGVMTDDGGYQTGAWGAAGAQNEVGRWRVSGNLRKGVLQLISPDGKETVHQYQVHVEKGETYWGEYYFDGKLYSVKYIYR